MKLISIALLGSLTFGQTGSRTTPPTIRDVTPRGVARGTTAELVIEGFNLAKASAIYFNQPGIKGRIVSVKELPDLADIRLGSNGTLSTIDLGPLPPRNRVAVEVEVEPEADISEVKFRLQTPLGTSPEGTILVEPYYGEAPDKEPNDTPEGAFETFLPAILVGAISKPGDVDHFKIHVKAGQELVFDNGGMQLGSALLPVISIVRADGSVVRESGADGRAEQHFAHKFAQDGVYYVKVSDYQNAGSGNHTYRIKVGEFGVAKSVFPLGVERGKQARVDVAGYRMTSKLDVKGEPSAGEENVLTIRPKDAFNEVKLAVGDGPETMAAANASLAAAQTVTAPVTINGRLMKPEEHFYRFAAKKGERFTLEVMARRLGSELDSYIEVTDLKGAPIERAVVRSVSETNTVLRDHDSALPGIRIQNWSTMAVGDWVMVGSEVLRIEALPRGPDDDLRVESFGNQRIGYFDTTNEAHAIDKGFYKVQLHPAGSKFTPNGLPLVRLYYRNDDGGPGYGKDSKLNFTAPADGEYIARIRDVQGLGGPNYAYRLSIRAPRPDFRLTADPRNPNVPVGGSIPVTVTAFRMDGFEDPINVTLDGLPAGLTATRGEIGRGQITATIILTASADARLAQAAPLKVLGTAGALSHWANPEDRMKLISLMPRADIAMTAVTREVTLEPGGTADIKVKLARHNGFGGRVPVEVRNLPPRVRVLDVGLNGVLLNEDETERTFTIEALPSAEPVEQLIYLSGKVETRSALQTSYAAPEAVLVKVKARATLSAAK